MGAAQRWTGFEKEKMAGLPGGQVVKNLPCNAEIQVESLVWEDLPGAAKPVDHN